MAQTESLVLVGIEDRIATVTLNRPQARNALSRQLTHSLWDAVAGAGDDPGVDAVILTGVDPAFCAGIDLKEAAGETPPSAPPREPGHGPERDTNGLYRFFPVIDKPVIGAINGVAVTGGLEIALQCTFLVASERAHHVVPHEELLPFTRRLANDIVSNDRQSVRRLLQHYREIANAATLDEAHLLEGYMAETWQPGLRHVAERRAEVTARGRTQSSR